MTMETNGPATTLVMFKSKKMMFPANCSGACRAPLTEGRVGLQVESGVKTSSLQDDKRVLRSTRIGLKTIDQQSVPLVWIVKVNLWQALRDRQSVPSSPDYGEHSMASTERPKQYVLP
ncbi:hypothetical protein E3N88_26845 [Mikania micrantha]|uniref:Uncharacterized protein n=1 Tax=Mikania micrantha TaxID=192012 RepID=A0A5N6MWI6_9ASTR|nr:hypothetical protein E3N88_26845 [Mikania micrantha]